MGRNIFLNPTKKQTKVLQKYFSIESIFARFSTNKSISYEDILRLNDELTCYKSSLKLDIRNTFKLIISYFLTEKIRLLKEYENLINKHDKMLKNNMHVLKKDEEFLNLMEQIIKDGENNLKWIVDLNLEVRKQRKYFNNKYSEYYPVYEKILSGKSKITKEEYNFAYSITTETDIYKIRQFPAFIILCYRKKDSRDIRLLFPNLNINDKKSLRQSFNKFYKAKFKYDKG